MNSVKNNFKGMTFKGGGAEDEDTAEAKIDINATMRKPSAPLSTYAECTVNTFVINSFLPGTSLSPNVMPMSKPLRRSSDKGSSMPSAE